MLRRSRERWVREPASSAGLSVLHTTFIKTAASGPVFVGSKIFSSDLSRVQLSLVHQ